MRGLCWRILPSVNPDRKFLFPLSGLRGYPNSVALNLWITRCVLMFLRRESFCPVPTKAQKPPTPSLPSSSFGARSSHACSSKTTSMRTAKVSLTASRPSYRSVRCPMCASWLLRPVPYTIYVMCRCSYCGKYCVRRAGVWSVTPLPLLFNVQTS